MPSSPSSSSPSETSPAGRPLAWSADCWPSIGIFALAFVAVALASHRLGIVDGEAAHLEAATGYGRLIEAAHHEGWRSLTRDDVAKELGTARSYPVFPHGLAGLSWLATARRTDHAWLTELTALRLPALLAAAAVPALVYLLARGALTRRWALLAAALAFLGPRLLVDDVSLGGGAPLVAACLVALLAHRMADASGSWRWSTLGGLAMGAALAQSFAPLLLFVPPLVLAWRADLAGQGEEAEAGTFRLSRGMCGWLFVGAPVAYVCSPAWQPLSTEVVLVVFERTLSPVLSATRALGRLPTELAPPRWHALEALLLAVPSTTWAVASVGLGATLRGVDRLPRAERRVVRMAFAHVGLLALWPALVPRALGSYPWPWPLAMPFLAIAGAHGAWFLARFLSRESLVMALFLVEPLVSSADLATAPASSGWLVRPPSAVTGLAPFDAAIVGPLLPVIGERARQAPLGRPLRVYAPDISPDTWQALHRFRRLPRAVVAVRGLEGADLAILTPEKEPPRGATELARAVRGARVVLRLYGLGA